MEDIIKKAVLTEKAEVLKSQNKYIFEVDKRANKIQIRKAIEFIFKVKVMNVRTSTIKPISKVKYGKAYKTSYIKKAIIKLSPGNEINFRI